MAENAASKVITSECRHGHYLVLLEALKSCAAPTFASSNLEALARAIELVVADYAHTTVASSNPLKAFIEPIYTHKINDIIHNIYRNKDLIGKIKELIDNRELEKLPYMHPHELFPKHWKEILDKKENTESSLKNLPTVHLPEIICKKCKGVDYYYFSMQTRSGDEPETIFLRCSQCGHTIKR